MKRTLYTPLIFSFVGIAVFFSCKKENLCEGCINGNHLPVANAGNDAVITLPTDSILLDGSSSSDPDGKISAWLWTKIAGPASFAVSSPASSKAVAKNLIGGVYQFELKVTDNKGASAKDTVMITVNAAAPVNHAPLANAGNDTIITLPANTANLDGSKSTDPDNNITSYQWTKIAGPSSFNMVNANAVTTQVNSLVEGTYLFELKVTDAGGLYSKDTMKVTVWKQPLLCTSCKIVFVSNRDGNDEIYSCNADGSNIIRLTNDPAKDEQAAWSPDGTKIAFISDRSGNPELYIMNADGSNVVRRTFSASYSQNPAWSPDGAKIAYSTLSNGSANIWVISATNGSPSLLFGAPGYDDHPTWSPDGTKIALISDWAAYDFVYDIYTINADGTGFMPLTGNIFDYFDYLHPSWSPNGMKLAMAISETTGIDQYNTKVGVMNPDGSGVRAIKSGAAAWTRTSWSGDGTKIIYTSLSGLRKDISWVAADGSASGTIVSNGWDADWQH